MNKDGHTRPGDPSAGATRDPLGVRDSLGALDPIEACDDLAELFLGPAPASLREHDPHRHDADDATAALHDPAIDSAGAAEPGAIEADDCIGVVDEERRSREVTIEAVIAGHLPGMPAAWIGQYAHGLAQGSGDPVGLIRISRGQLMLRVFGRDMIQGAWPHASAAEALAAAAPYVRRWLFRADDAASAMTSPEAADLVTVLASASSVATVAAYRTLKELVPGGNEPPAAGARHRRLRIALLDEGNGAAGLAAARLREVVEGFLDYPVETMLVRGQLGRQPGVTLYEGPCELDRETIFERLAEIVQMPQREAAPAASDPDLRSGRPDAERYSAHTDDSAGISDRPGILTPRARYRPRLAGIDMPSGAHLTAQDTVSATALAHGDAVHGSRPASAEPSGVGTPPAAARSPTAADPGTPEAAPDARHRSGVALLELIPGLRPLFVECPYARGVTLACDGAGALHALVLARTEAETRNAIADLGTVGSWLSQHAALVSQAAGLREVGPNPGQWGTAEPGMPRVRLHLLTTTPGSLRAMLDGDIVMHAVTVAARGDGGESLAAVRLN